MLKVMKIAPLKLVLKDADGFLEQAKSQGGDAYIQALKVVKRGTVIINHVVSVNGVVLYDTGIPDENATNIGTIGLLIDELRYFKVGLL